MGALLWSITTTVPIKQLQGEIERAIPCATLAAASNEEAAGERGETSSGSQIVSWLKTVYYRTKQESWIDKFLTANKREYQIQVFIRVH